MLGRFAVEYTQRFGDDFHTGLFQRLIGVAADMRRGAEVRQAQQLVLARRRLVDKRIAGSGLQLAGHQCIVQGVFVDHSAAGGVDENSTGLEVIEHLAGDHTLGVGYQRDIDIHHVGSLQQFLHGIHLFKAASGSFLCIDERIVAQHLYAETLVHNVRNALGNIAQRIAHIMNKGFGVKVLGYDPFINAEEAARRGFEKVDTMEELLERSDMVNINVPLVPNTEGMISREMFDHFKPGAVFVNAARGAVIDEDALYDALVSGKLKAAACDTFINEPPTGENKLLSLPNFSATPHIGGNTYEALEKAGMEVVTETLRVLNGEAPKHPYLM